MVRGYHRDITQDVRYRHVQWLRGHVRRIAPLKSIKAWGFEVRYDLG